MVLRRQAWYQVKKGQIQRSSITSLYSLVLRQRLYILVSFSSHRVMPKRKLLIVGEELFYSMCHPSWSFWEIQIIFLRHGRRDFIQPRLPLTPKCWGKGPS